MASATPFSRLTCRGGPSGRPFSGEIGILITYNPYPGVSSWADPAGRDERNAMASPDANHWALSSMYCPRVRRTISPPSTGASHRFVRSACSRAPKTTHRPSGERVGLLMSLGPPAPATNRSESVPNSRSKRGSTSRTWPPAPVAWAATSPLSPKPRPTRSRMDVERQLGLLFAIFWIRLNIGFSGRGSAGRVDGHGLLDTSREQGRCQKPFRRRSRTDQRFRPKRATHSWSRIATCE